MNRNEYLLSLISEECAEISQRVNKALGFGFEEVQQGQPLDKDFDNVLGCSV